MNDRAKFTAASIEQSLKDKKERMFRAVPGSIDHTIAVIAFDRVLLDARTAKREMRINANPNGAA